MKRTNADPLAASACPTTLPAAAAAMPGMLVMLGMLAVLGVPSPAGAQERPAVEYEGAVATGLALRRLGNTARVLHIGAHPDDENTALFAPLALGRGADAAYLSITRGEGGQNSLGPELGTALGLIRTEELLAARRIDGAAQFFTRAVDFGFSKNAEETFTHWPRDSVLADIVAVIRRYRPDVVVSVWSGTRRDGHGHHEASGILAREAVLAAGDPARFPQQITAGLRPHRVTAYYWSARYGADGPDVELNTGELDPLLGRSYHQIAMASRSRHRSQDMGVPQAPGPRRTQFDRIDPADPPEVAPGPGPGPGRQLEGEPLRGGSLFAGVDTLLSQRATAAGLDRAAERLEAYEEQIVAVRERFDPFAPWDVVPSLLEAGDALESAAGAVATAGAAAADLRFHLGAEARDLRDATIAAGNLILEAVSDDELIVPGQTFELELSGWNGGNAAMFVRMEPALPAGWTATRLESEADDEGAFPVRPGDRVVTRWSVHVPRDAAPTQPYFLDDDGDDDPESALYEWPNAPDVRGLPFAAAPVRGRFTLEFPSDGDATYHVERDAAWIGLDAREGEFRRPVRVVRRVSMNVAPDVVAVPLERLREPDTHRIPITVTIRNEAPESATGKLLFAVESGWSVVPDALDLTLAAEGGERTVRFDVAAPADLAAGEYSAGSLFMMEIPGCDTMPCAAMPWTFVDGYRVIDYSHIDAHRLYRDARSRIRLLDVRVADVRVGYVAGVPDGVPEALDQLGVTWVPLGEATLTDGDLSRFDVIVTGTRAYEVRPDLVAHNDRLLDWTRAGGTMIVQYNKYPALEGSYAPWPVTIARPHGRVTDETAPVTVLEPDHPIFNTPNRIGADAWEGWVQERGLYFWEAWEGPLRPLLAMNDPGETPLEGSLLVAPLGDGTYVYSALAMFRQLPEGVPGAWRLLANLVSLGAAGADDASERAGAEGGR